MADTAAKQEDTATTGLGASSYRSDLDGLRAVSVLLVVLFHADVPPFTGGFVGVDVFFVLSGYLITGLLLRESGVAGGISIAAFWARRARRLLPAATVVVLCTLVAGMIVSSPLRWQGLATEALASSMYVANFAFGFESLDYFAPAVESSPFLHMWSLSIEEQFYILWPLGILGLLAVGRRWTRQTRAVVIGVGLVTVVSFLLSLLLTTRGTPWAYFATPSRAWELSIGALGAALGHRFVRRGSSPWGSVPTSVGLTAIGLAAVLYDDFTPFPGLAALLPVAGALLVLLRPAPDHSVVHRVMSTPGVQWLGKRSYSWYLWHWPVLILAGELIPEASIDVRIALVLGALVVAAASYRWVEQPIRHHRTLVASNRASLVLAAGLMTLSVATGVAAWAVAERAADDPLLRELAAARADRATQFSDHGCTDLDPEWLRSNCVTGSGNADRLVVVAGDSHAEHWAPAIDEAAKTLDMGMVVLRQSSCPLIPVTPVSGHDGGSQCSKWQGDVLETIRELDPALVITSNSAAYANPSRPPPEGQESPIELDDWSHAVERLSRALAADGIGLGLIHDTPRLVDDPIDCVARARTSIACEPRRSEALSGLDAVKAAEVAGLSAAGGAAGAESFDPVPLLCDESNCALEDGSVWLYSDTNHLTATAARSLSDRLLPWISELLT